MERVERLSYLSYVETRKLAQYAHSIVQLAQEGEAAKAMPGMRALSDDDALRFGMEMEDLIALKFKMRFLTARCRRDALGIAKELADERKRRPAVPQPEEARPEEAVA